MNKKTPNSQKNASNVNQNDQKDNGQKSFDWEFDCEDDENYEPSDKDLVDANNWDDLEEFSDYEELENDETEYHFLKDED